MSAIRGFGLMFLVLLTAVTVAGADDEFINPSRWSYRTEAGVLMPSPKAYPRMGLGPHVLGAVDFEMNRAFFLGSDVSFGASSDELGTRVTSVGLHTRISPSSEFTAFYVIASLGAYEAKFDPKDPALQAPGTRLRPGASFGFGYDLWTFTKLTVTSTATFQGVFTRGNSGRNIALEFFTLRLGLWYRSAGP